MRWDLSGLNDQNFRGIRVGGGYSFGFGFGFGVSAAGSVIAGMN
jgi:hypothetical protein